MTARTTTQAFFDPSTWTVSYVVSDNATRHAAVIDPVLDYDFKSGHTDTKAADKVVAYQLITPDALVDFADYGGWLGFRTIIDDDGTWQAWVAGD